MAPAGKLFQKETNLSTQKYFLATVMASQPPPWTTYHPRNKGFMAGNTKGNHRFSYALNKAGYLWGGGFPIRGGVDWLMDLTRRKITKKVRERGNRGIFR